MAEPLGARRESIHVSEIKSVCQGMLRYRCMTEPHGGNIFG